MSISGSLGTHILFSARAKTTDCKLINILHGEEWLDDLAIAAMRASGLSLASMRDRLKLLKGEFSIDAQPKLGTRIHAGGARQLRKQSTTRADG